MTMTSSNAAKPMTVVQRAPGRWAVCRDGEVLRDGFATHSAAWEWLDVHDLRPGWKTSRRHFWGR
jgi:hypothetical protein